MHGLSKHSQSWSLWHWLGLVGLIGLTFGLRFWGLERFNTLVFDEVYYAKYGHNYLTNIPFFDAHPPLGKYLIAVGMWFSDRVAIDSTAVNGLTGSVRSPWSYRWFNALVGSFVPFVIAGIAYQLSQRWRYAILAGLFTTLDGLLLVESRYALINIYLVFFGLLGHWLFLAGLGQSKLKRSLSLAAAGVALGAAISVKWNGLAFLLGLYGIWIVGWLNYLWKQRHALGAVHVSHQDDHSLPQSVLQRLPELSVGSMLTYLGALPVLVYGLIWIPHLHINKTSLWELHTQIFNYHAQMDFGPQVHPYCSRWYTWPWMLRPMSYFYETTRSLNDPLPPLTPKLPPGAGQVVYDVHAMGNPFLWWFSALALIFLIELLVEQVPAWIQGRVATSPMPESTWTNLYLCCNYAISFLPWAVVSRCTFIYLYMGASVFGFLAIAHLVDRWLDSAAIGLRIISMATIFAIVASFGFWSPIYLGWPLSLSEFQMRMWLQSWI
jgi:dolichyl-phosphate-mannose--protein O-mannosyl transferase